MLALAEATQAQLDAVGSAEILVGIPSYNNARTIGHVVRAVRAGLAKYFPHTPAVLVNSDGGSRDGTQEVVAQADLDSLSTILVSHDTVPLQKIVTPYHGIPGKGSALRTIFEIARRLNARACAVVDSDLRSITPEWIELLVKPVYQHGFDYVAPLYTRHKYDGTITNSIIYPLTRALYGKRIRQPIGGEFGFSGALAAHYLEQDVWETDIARFGIDIWMTTTAIVRGGRIAQAYLGAKIHDAKDPGADLSAMFTQVVGSVFSLMETYYPVWSKVEGSEAVPLLGFPFSVGVEPIQVNVERMVSHFRQGADELTPIWEKVFPRERLLAIQDLGGQAWGEFAFPDELWVDAVIDLALGYHRRVLARDILMKSIIPLYMGRTAAWVNATRESDAEDVEARIERLCVLFEAKKPSLVGQWD